MTMESLEAKNAQRKASTGNSKKEGNQKCKIRRFYDQYYGPFLIRMGSRMYKVLGTP